MIPEKKMKSNKIKDYLDQQLIHYYSDAFIPNDPISIPHHFDKREDIEIAGFLTSIISWGRRDQILKNAHKMMALLEGNPHDFILDKDKHDSLLTSGFVHRTFNCIDLHYFVKTLHEIYTNEGGLEHFFKKGIAMNDTNLKNAISLFKQNFFAFNPPSRTTKHLPDPQNGSAAKRFNMFLRWMVRTGNESIDFGLWTSISPSLLSCPLDVHSGRIARELGLITRKQNDWKALEELDAWLRTFDPEDPCKYDYALFSLGVNKDFEQ